MKTLLGLAYLIVVIWAIVDCFKSALTSGKKALWIILILVFPLLGLILYLLMGRKKIS